MRRSEANGVRGRPARAPAGLGPELVREREAGVAWKILQRRTGLSRSRLYALWLAERKKERPRSN
jgi:hypothetical protein